MHGAPVLPAQQCCWPRAAEVTPGVWYLLLELSEQPLEFLEIIKMNLPNFSARVSWLHPATFLGCFTLEEAFSAFRPGECREVTAVGWPLVAAASPAPGLAANSQGLFSSLFNLCTSFYTHLKAAPVLVWWKKSLRKSSFTESCFNQIKILHSNNEDKGLYNTFY